MLRAMQIGTGAYFDLGDIPLKGATTSGSSCMRSLRWIRSFAHFCIPASTTATALVPNVTVVRV